MTPIEEEYQRRCASPSDINEHLPRLKELASECRHVTEFGVRSGNSTTALLAGLESSCGGNLVSYDIAAQEYSPPALNEAAWSFIQADTAKLDAIDLTEMLFIDTLHDRAQVEAELKRAPWVLKYIVFHDTVLFGWREETTGDPPGIMQAILEFMATDDGRRWRVKEHHTNNCGLLVLERPYL